MDSSQEFSLNEIQNELTGGTEFYVVDGTATVVRAPEKIAYHLAENSDGIDPCTEVPPYYAVEEYMALVRKVNIEHQIAYEAAESKGEKPDFKMVEFVICAKNADGTYKSINKGFTDITAQEVSGIFDDGEGYYLALVIEDLPVTTTKIDGIATSIQVDSCPEIVAESIIKPISEAETYEHCVYGIYDDTDVHGGEIQYVCVKYENGTCQNEDIPLSLDEIQRYQACGSEFYVIDGTATFVNAPEEVLYHTASKLEEIDPCTNVEEYTETQCLDLIRTVNIENLISYEEAEKGGQSPNFQEAAFVVAGKNADGTYKLFVSDNNGFIDATATEIQQIFEDGEGYYLMLVLEAPEESAKFAVWIVIVAAVLVLIGAYVAGFFFLYKKGKLTAAFFTKFYLPMTKIFKA